MKFVEEKFDVYYDLGVYLFAAGFGVMVDSSAVNDWVTYAVKPDRAFEEFDFGGRWYNALEIDDDGKWILGEDIVNHVMRVRCVKN